MECLCLAKQRTTIERDCHYEHACQGGGADEEKKSFLIVRGTNVGSKKTTITNVVILSYDNIWQRFRNKPTWSAVFNDQGGDYPIPYVLNVGHDFMSKADQVDLVSRIRNTYFYAGIAHSSANKPVMVRVKFRNQNSVATLSGRKNPHANMLFALVAVGILDLPVSRVGTSTQIGPPLKSDA